MFDNDTELQTGTIVRFNLNRPYMTIENVANGIANATYFNKDNRLFKVSVPIECLEEAPQNEDLLEVISVLATTTEQLEDDRFHSYITAVPKDDPLAPHGYGHTKEEARGYLSKAAMHFAKQKVIG